MQAQLANSLSQVSDYATPRNVAFGAGALAGLYAASSLYRASQLPPGPWGLPLIGCLPWMDPDHLNETEEEMHKKYGPIFSYRAGQRLMVVLSSSEMVKEMFKMDEFSGRMMPPEGTKLSEGCGLAFTEGKKWVEQRRVVMRVLRDHGLGKDASVHSINAEIDLILESLDAKPLGVDTADLFVHLSNSVISTLLFGRRYANEDKRFRQMMDNINLFFDDSFSGSLSLMFPTFSFVFARMGATKKATQATLETHDFLTEEIAKREAELPDLTTEPICLSDTFIQERRRAEARGDYESHNPFDLVRICFEMFLAGTDTSAKSLQWLMLHTALHPEVQKKVQEEIDGNIGQQRRPTLADKANLNYTQAVVDESLRRAALAFNGVPHHAFADTKFRGYNIPADAAILSFIEAVHHDPKVWARPYEFYPEHFLDSDGKYKASKHLMPFSIGKRVCPGENLAKLEMLLAFTGLMQKYSVQLADSSKGRIADILRGATTTIRAAGKHHIDFIRR